MTLPVSIIDPAQLAYLLGIAAVLGACLGSFFNCFAWRLVHGESVLHGRSHCATCNHVLGPLDLIPVFSWFFLRGRCRYCGERVSPRYMLVELVMALLFVALFLRYGFGIQACAYAALACILLALSLVDLDTYQIPNGFIVAGCVLWLASVWFMPLPQAGSVSPGSLFAGLLGYTRLALLVDGLVGFFGVGVFVLAMSLVVDKFTGRQSLGGGDVKLLAALGLFLGLAGSFICLFIACICGLVFACMQQLSSKRNARPLPDSQDEEGFCTKAIPFGPSIALAACITLLFGWQVLGWYVGLF